MYLDEHEAHTWQDTLQILGGLIAFVGIIHLIFLVRPILFKKTDNEYDVRKKQNSDKFIGAAFNQNTHMWTGWGPCPHRSRVRVQGTCS